MRARQVLGIGILCAGSALAAAGGTITVKISNAAGRTGEVRAVLFRGPAGFPKGLEQAVQRAVAVWEGDMAVAIFRDVPPGEYAIVTVHDTNQNGKLDTNFIGIPKEPYGFSNEARGRLGPPAFRAAAFSVEGGAKEVRIRMIR